MSCVPTIRWEGPRRVWNQDTLEFIKTESAFVCRAEHVLEFRFRQLLHPLIGMTLRCRQWFMLCEPVIGACVAPIVRWVLFLVSLLFSSFAYSSAFNQAVGLS